MDPDYLLFAKVVETGSFRRASAALGISPAMMSKRVARLEARLGVQLIHRTTRKLVLSQAGDQLHRDLIDILGAIRVAEERVTDRRMVPSGVLRVSAPTSFGRLHVAPLLPSFLARYPAVSLELDLTDAYVDILADRLDVAIRIADHVPASLQGRRLAANRRVLCTSPDYIAAYGRPATIDDLARHRLLAADGQLPWRLASGRMRRQIDGRSVVRTNSSEIVRELALAGLGIALRSLWDVADMVADGRLVRLLDRWEGPDDLAVHAVLPKGAGQPAAVHAFIDHLEDAFAVAAWNTGSA